MECIFCKPDTSLVFLENELAYAKFDRFPVSNGHALIIPKRHVADFFGATQAELLAMTALMHEAKKIIDEKHKPDGYNIGANCGAVAGQTVFHLHLHLIPRYIGDVENPRGGVRGVIPQKQNYSMGGTNGQK
jgi:diadenosine tetraphosphate (Ap4A) HIT family hydrolase